jgi:SulP family sulfate permease
MLTTMFKRSSPPENGYCGSPMGGQGPEDHAPAEESDADDQDALTRVPTAESRPLLAHAETAEDARETAPLIATRSRESQRGGYGTGRMNGHGADLEGQKPPSRRRWQLWGTGNPLRRAGRRVANFLPVVGNPKRWNGRMLLHHAVLAPAACLPAVTVGLLLNILDALSYGQSP